MTNEKHNSNDPDRQETEEKYQNLIEPPEYRREIERWYRKEKKIQEIIFFLCLVSLGISRFGQFALLEYSFGIRFNLLDTEPILGVSIKALLSLVVTSAFPIATLLDESNFFDKKIKISFYHLKLSPIIWVVLPGDMLLTFQAILVANQDNKERDIFIPVIAFILAAFFSILVFYLSKSISTAVEKYMLVRKHLEIVSIYGINPKPFYKDAEQIKVIQERDAAKKEAEKMKRKLEVLETEKLAILFEAEHRHLRHLEAKTEVLEQLKAKVEDSIEIEATFIDINIGDYVDTQLLAGFNRVSQLYQESLDKGDYAKAAEAANEAYNLCQQMAESLDQEKEKDIYRRVIALASYWKLARDLYTSRSRS